jgi:hypothetical protein
MTTCPVATSAITWCDSGPWWWRARSRRYLKPDFDVFAVNAAATSIFFSLPLLMFRVSHVPFGGDGRLHRPLNRALAGYQKGRKERIIGSWHTRIGR